MKRVIFQLDYGMVSHGLAPLYVDGAATELQFWGFSNDILRRLTRLNELYDRQVNWDNPTDRTWRISDRDRNESTRCYRSSSPNCRWPSGISGRSLWRLGRCERGGAASGRIMGGRC